MMHERTIVKKVKRDTPYVNDIVVVLDGGVGDPSSALGAPT